MRLNGRRIDSDVCVIVQGCRVEDVYYGCWTGFCVCGCAEVSLYVYLYKCGDLFEGNESGFCVVFSSMCVRGQSKMWLFCVIELYRVVHNRCRNAWSFLI